MGFDVFISYSRKDYTDENQVVRPDNIVSKIKYLFDANNITYWFDEDGIYSGDAFAPLIAKNIKASKVFLFISSENSNASEWTSNEIATAHLYKKKIIPLRYDDSVYNDSVIIYVARLDYIDYFVNKEKSLERLLSSVKNYLQKLADIEVQEREVQEQRIREEATRKERAEIVVSLNDHIKKLEVRCTELDGEILQCEQSLIQLRNEKRIVESGIEECQEQIANIIGTPTLQHSKNVKIGNVDGVKEQSMQSHNENQKSIKKETSKTDADSKFCKYQWRKFKVGLQSKHPILRWLLLFDIVYSIIQLLYGLSQLDFVPSPLLQSSFVVARLCVVVFIISSKPYGFIVSFVFTTFIAGVTWTTIGISTPLKYLFVSVCIYSLLLFLRKDGVSSWSQLINGFKKNN